IAKYMLTISTPSQYGDEIPSGSSASTASTTRDRRISCISLLRRKFGWLGMPIASDLPRALAEQALRAEQQDQDQQHQPEGVAVVVRDVDRAEALEHAERECRDDAARNRAHPADDHDHVGLDRREHADVGRR